MNRDKIRRNCWRIFELTCYIFIFIALIFCISIFMWGHEIHWHDDNYIVDGDHLGNLGDFIAGTVGSFIALVSMFLLYRTLRLQSITNRDNRTLLEVQRFNDLYFNLLSILDQKAPTYSKTTKFREEITNDAASYKSFEKRKDVAMNHTIESIKITQV